MENTLAYLLLCLFAGIIGSLLMDLFMFVFSYNTQPRVRMTEALGSLITGKLEGSHFVGLAIHLVSGVLFGFIYGLIMAAAQATALPFSIFLGLGMGLFHGIFFSYCLMFIASERHPIPKYREATMQTGALHLLGHIIYGGSVGLIIGMFPT